MHVASAVQASEQRSAFFTFFTRAMVFRTDMVFSMTVSVIAIGLSPQLPTLWPEVHPFLFYNSGISFIHKKELSITPNTMDNRAHDLFLAVALFLKFHLNALFVVAILMQLSAVSIPLQTIAPFRATIIFLY